MARDNAPDELQHLRKRARRRLVGAVALVLFSLTVLWTVLDSQPPANLAAQHPVEIIASAPSSGNASDVMVVPAMSASVAAANQPDGLTPPAPVAATPAPVVAAANTKPSETGQTTHAPDALPGKLSRVQGDDAAAAPPKTHTPTPTPAKLATAKPKPTAAPENKSADKPAPKAREVDPESILNGTDGGSTAPVTTKADAAPATGHHYVQLGAYGNADKAKEVVGKLKAAGLPAFSEKITTSTGTLTRVRVGPVLASEAFNVSKKLSGMGYQGQVVSK
ncbi:SPOR domain-containing protein [Silvimonas sp.]|uniref:SPOR domain-containing protein n=1 Tax=Silvimonas sp. TaxID=2650811 RepID=UPI002848F8FE|nr:SPOR domain-containing protein [Silvimonas sp.]MDR3429098.1 SPOR domain-containing protein [Silvimonas sp.]